MNQLLERLRFELLENKPAGLSPKPSVDLILGNDREIGRERNSQEKRVGITPGHIKDLKDFFSTLGLRLNVFVMQGAGQRAGFSDSEFIRQGDEILAEIITEAELEFHDRAPDVFHALKEPSKYESLIPMPFCRIGAMHGGNFHADSGLAKLLEKGRVAVFDGSNIGAVNRIPIRGRMSEFAGEIAADWITEHLVTWQQMGQVVIVGGGRAGQAAAKKLNKFASVTRIFLFEDKTTAGRVETVRGQTASLQKVEVVELNGRDDPSFLEKLGKDCAAVLFAVARPGEEAPKVVHISRLAELKEKAIVVDISIDEKGAIFDPSIAPEWEASRIIEHLEPLLKKNNIVYRAQENMPRSRAKEASEAHGDVILPYLATLLYHAAWQGGAVGLCRFITQRPVDSNSVDPMVAPPGKLLDALTQDLRNGLAFYTASERVVVEDIVPDRFNLLKFFLGKQIPFEFSLPERDSLNDEKILKTESALELFSEDVREFLKFAFANNIAASVISHPQIDGTTTRGASDALGVKVSAVLKTLIWKKDEELIATISGGDKHVDKKRLREVTEANQLTLARPNEVMAATGHVPGAVPTIGLFMMKEVIKTVYVSDKILHLDQVYGSAGSIFLGLKFDPHQLLRLGARAAELTPSDSVLRKEESLVRKLWGDIEMAIERDDDELGAKSIQKLRTILSRTVKFDVQDME